MATTEARLGAPYIIEGQDEKELAHSEGVNRHAAIIMLSALDRDLADPDSLGSPTADIFSDGDIYLVPSGASGPFAGQDDNIAAYYSGWIFMTANEGWRCYIEDENRTLVYQDGAWADYLPVNGLVESLGGMIEEPADKDYILDESAAYAYQIETLIGICVDNDVTATLKINGNSVPGIIAENFGPTQSTASATAGSPISNQVQIGDRLVLTLAAGSPAPGDFSFTLKTTRL
jgi:hypothetical protein